MKNKNNKANFDSLVKKYEKKLTVTSKKSIPLVIALASSLVAFGGLTAGHFAYKARNSIANNHEIILDPTTKDDATISDIVTTPEGNKVGTVTSSTKKIATVKVSIGTNLLVETTDYKLDPIDGIVNGFKVTVFQSAINKYSGAINLSPKFEETPVSDYYMIQFDTDGGTAVDPIKVPKGEKASKPNDPTKTDYIFAGWYYKNASGVEIDFDFDKTIIENDLILHARWNLPEIDGLIYVYDINTKGYLTGLKLKSSNNSNIEIPSRFSIPKMHQGIPVTGIVEDGFSDIPGIIEVNLPDTIQIIGVDAFKRCPNLSKINIPSSCLIISEGAFDGCTSLYEVKFSEGLLAIENEAFDGCSALVEINLPDSLVSMGEEAFQSCDGLYNIHLGKGLTSLPYFCFEGCSSLNSIYIPNTIRKINNECFVDCENLQTVTFEDKISDWYAEDEEDPIDPKEIVNYLVNRDVTLEKVTYKDPDETYFIQYIGDQDGEHLCYLSINDDSFESGSKFVVPDTIDITVSEKKYTLTVAGLSDSCFEGSENISEVVLPSTLTYIGANAFKKSTITKVSFEDSNNINLKVIDQGAFYNSNVVSFNADDTYEFNIPDGVTTLGANAFTNLNLPDVSIYVPETVVLMDYEKRSGTYSEEDESFNTNPFTGSLFKEVVFDEDNPYFSSDSNGIYLKSTTDETATKETLILAFVTDLTDYKYTISTGVKNVINFCFDTYGLMGQPISELTISKDVSYIAPFNYIFMSDAVIDENNENYIYESTAESKILYGVVNNEKKIIHHCFNTGTELTEFTVPSTIEEIGSFAFYNLDGIKLTLNDNTKRINHYAFANTTIGEAEEDEPFTFKIPSSIEFIGYYAFSDFYDDVTIVVDSEYVINQNFSGLFENDNCIIYVKDDIEISDYTYFAYNYIEDTEAEEKPGYTAYKFNEEE